MPINTGSEVIRRRHCGNRIRIVHKTILTCPIYFGFRCMFSFAIGIINAYIRPTGNAVIVNDPACHAHSVMPNVSA